MRYIAIAISALLLVMSCAKEKSETEREIQERILDAYVQQNYPNATKLSSGLVIISQEGGSGRRPVNGQSAYLRYSSKELDGTYLSTTQKELAEQLGTYSASVYYGPQLMTLGYGTTLRGLNQAIKEMNRGCKMTIILPPWLSDYDGESSYAGTSVETQNHANSVIYELEMSDIVNDIGNFQIDSLEAYRDIHFPGVDSTAKGYYFKKLSGTVTDTVVAESVVKVYYIGRLLDGYIFDTNIQDTAKKYRIYDADKSYDALEVTMKPSYSEMTSTGTADESTTTYVEGFARALKSMTYGDTAVTFFWSYMGYGDEDTREDGVGVPEYSMMRFDLYMMPEEKSDDDE